MSLIKYRPTEDYYTLLDVKHDATAAEIRKAFKGKALKAHPDRNDDSAAANTRTQKLVEARDVLCNPATRTEYDAARGAALLKKALDKIAADAKAKRAAASTPTRTPINSEAVCRATAKIRNMPHVTKRPAPAQPKRSQTPIADITKTISDRYRESEPLTAQFIDLLGALGDVWLANQRRT